METPNFDFIIYLNGVRRHATNVQLQPYFTQTKKIQIQYKAIKQ